MSEIDELKLLRAKLKEILAVLGGGAGVSSDINSVGSVVVPTVGGKKALPTIIYDSLGNQVDEFGLSSVLPVAGAVAATPSAIVDRDGNQVDSFGSPSTISTHRSPTDFTATCEAASNDVTLSGYSPITNNAQIVYIRKVPLAGDAAVYVNGSGGVTMSFNSTTSKITVSGAGTTVFAMGDAVEVGINYGDKAYSSARDAIKIDQINSDADRTTPYPTPLTTVTAGGYGATITTTVANGAVTVATIDAGGTNYAVGNILRLEGGDYNCWVKVATLTGSAIATLTIVQPGTGYTNGETYSAYLYTPVVSDISGLPTGAIKHLSFGGYMLDADATIKFIILGSNNTDTNDWSGTTTPFKRWHNIRFYDECADTFTNHIDSTNAYKVINAEIENLNREYFQFGLLTNSAGFEYAIFARTKVI